jgi:hypothetical protein
MAQSTASKETQNEPKKRTRKAASGDGQAPAQAEKPAGKRAASSKSADDKKAPAAKKTAGSRAKKSDGAAAKKSDGAAAKKPRAKKGAAQDGPSREDIERRAYELYERRGGEHGLHDDDWLEAERQLREEAGS